MLSRKRLLLSCACALTAISSVAYAQAGDENTIEELVVTAEKREQSIQDVPVAISAFTDERRDLLGINNAQDLTNFTPGLNYNTGNDRMTMRGIGRLTNNRSSEGGVALYNDNLYTSSVYSFSKSSLFIDRTEVLRGPQGTLYGRNSIGGAMNIISKRPTDEFYAEVRGSYANYDNKTVEAAMSGPLFWGIEARVAGSYNDQGKGFYKNLAGGPSEGNRGEVYFYEYQFRGDLGDGKLEWWVKGEKSKSDFLGRGAGGRQGVRWGLPLTATTLVPGTTPSASFAYFNRTIPLASTICSRCFYSDTPNDIQIESENFTAQVTLHLDNFDIRYVGGRTWYHYELTTDVDGTENGTPFRVLPGQAGAPGTATGTGQIIPTGGTLFYPRLVNQYDEEPMWFSNEINIASTHDGPVQWLVGFYQFREEANYTPTDARSVDDARFATPASLTGGNAALNPNRSYAIGTSKTRSESYAAFGQVDWQINDQFKLTAGLRYTYDEKTAVEGARLICFMAQSAACPAAVSRLTGRPIDFTTLAVATGTQLDPSVKSVFNDPDGIRYRVLNNDWQGWGGTLGLDWKPDTDTLVYAKYTRGYKAGGFNSAQTTLPTFVTTKKEVIDAFELGAKKTINRNLQVNASAFYYDYKDLQAVMSTFEPLLNTNTSLYANLPKATISGFEAETIWQPIQNLQINANYAYLHSKIKEACCFQDPDDPTALVPGSNRAQVVGTSVLQDLKGARLGSATPHRVSLNANYTWEFEPGSLTLSSSYIWRSSTYFSVFNRYYNKGKAWEQIDARLLWNDADGKYTVIGFVKNLTDVKGQLTMAGSRITNPGPNFGFVNQDVGFTNPRTYGVEFQYRY
ncbi:MAG: TonB-dependent receptor [Pseudomonadota bacterium]